MATCHEDIRQNHEWYCYRLHCRRDVLQETRFVPHLPWQSLVECIKVHWCWKYLQYCRNYYLRWGQRADKITWLVICPTIAHACLARLLSLWACAQHYCCSVKSKVTSLVVTEKLAHSQDSRWQKMWKLLSELGHSYPNSRVNTLPQHRCSFVVVVVVVVL